MSTFIFILGLSSLFLHPPSPLHVQENILPRADVVIDVGHGGIDSGTTHGSLYEKKINLDIAKMTYELLLEKGINTVINRSEDRALSDDNHWLNNRSRHLRDLAQRKQLANDLNAKLMVSLHVNWSASERQGGPIVIHQGEEDSKLLANVIQQSLNVLYGSMNLPVLGKTYYLLKYANCPTAIVEMGFISNASDRERLTTLSKQREIAAAISSAIEQFLYENELVLPSEDFSS